MRRRRACSNGTLPSAVHYVGYVEEDETPRDDHEGNLKSLKSENMIDGPKSVCRTKIYNPQSCQIHSCGEGSNVNCLPHPRSKSHIASAMSGFVPSISQLQQHAC